MLEKRVKSRFSHRQLHLLPTFSFDQYVEAFASYLELPKGFGGDKKYVTEWNKQVKVGVTEIFLECAMAHDVPTYGAQKLQVYVLMGHIY